MKNFLILSIMLFTCYINAQSNITNNYKTLNQEGALKLAQQANLKAKELGKEISIAVLNSSGVTLLLLKGDNVGPHNTEASRKKAFTALSTKTPSLELMRKAANSKDAKNLNTIPELLLLGGGVPIWFNGNLIGSIGISGGGSGENDNNIAIKAIESLDFKITKN